MQLPTLIKWSYIPKDNDLSHPSTIVDEKNEIDLLGFINLGLNEKESHDFSEDYIRDWTNHISLKNIVDHVESTIQLPETLLAQYGAIVEPRLGETRTLMRYPPLLPFWYTIFLAKGKRCDSGMLRLQMDQCHPLDLLYLKWISDCIY